MKKIVTIDPALSNTAVVYSEIFGDKIVPKSYKLTQTKKSGDKKIPVMRDRFNRMTSHFSGLRSFIDACSPDLIVFEFPSGSKSSAAAVGIGYSIALASSLKADGYNVEGVTPTELKKQVNGTNSADKKEIIKYVENKYPNFLPRKNSKGDINEGKSEHIADAIVVAEVAVKKQLV